MKKEIKIYAEILWDYHHMKHELIKSDLILVLGNSDINTIYQGVKLYKENYAPYIAITGGSGTITTGIWKEAEADKFFRIAREQGVPEERILLENKSSNTGENYIFVRTLLEKNKIKFNKTIIVTKPYMERRAYATAKVHWPGINILVSSIPITLEAYISIIGDEDFVINMMVGDLQRIDRYPQMGFQIYQNIPKNVKNAFDILVKNGYNKRLI